MHGLTQTAHRNVPALNDAVHRPAAARRQQWSVVSSALRRTHPHFRHLILLSEPCPLSGLCRFVFSVLRHLLLLELHRCPESVVYSNFFIAVLNELLTLPHLGYNETLSHFVLPQLTPLPQLIGYNSTQHVAVTSSPSPTQDWCCDEWLQAPALHKILRCMIAPALHKSLRCMVEPALHKMWRCSVHR